MTDQKDHRLTVDVEEGAVVIRLGIDRLAHSTQTLPEFLDDAGKSRITVTDPDLFAREVSRALMSEEEDGSTPIDLLFDDAIRHAIDDGCEGLEFRD